MSPSKAPQPQNPDQGGLFDVTMVPSGHTDPEDMTISAQFTVAETGEGVFAAEVADYVGDPALLASVHQAVVTVKNSRAQLGKHSPLERDGNYTAVRPGDFLPGFGIVTHKNFDQARLTAASLERKRTGTNRNQSGA